MKVLVCGSRTFNDYAMASRILDTLQPTEIIHGGARGADSCGARYAESNSITVRCYPALWELDGRSAGPKRNIRMLEEGAPDRVLAFWDGKSKGTKHMIDIARKAGVTVELWAPETVDSPPEPK